MVRSRPRRQRRNAPLSNRRHLVRTVHRTELGMEFVPPTDPPRWTQSPWWPLTMTATVSVDTIFSVTALHTLLLAHLDLKAAANSKAEPPKFRIRIQTVRTWGLNKQPLMLEIYRVNAIGSVIKQIADNGSALNYSRLGWRFGLDSQIAIEGKDTDAVFAVKGTLDSTSKALIYISILFQMDNNLEPSLVRELTPQIYNLDQLTMRD